jgi:hypothetical protein
MELTNNNSLLNSLSFQEKEVTLYLYLVHFALVKSKCPIGQKSYLKYFSFLKYKNKQYVTRLWNGNWTWSSC